MSDENHNVCITVSDASRQNAATRLADATGIPFCNETDAALQLRFTEHGLELYDSEISASIAIDFLSGAIAHRERFGGGKGQAIAKAIGLNRYSEPSVMDVTAGLARDAWVLASLGCRMLLIERSVVLHAMISDALDCAREDTASTTVDNIVDLLNTDSIEHLASLEQEDYPDVIYMDPMFPDRNKSALVKKDMQILHKLIGHTPDEARLLQSARQHARRRVVVKRPAGAPHVDDQAPSHEINSKKTRYDVYMCDNNG